MRKIIVIFILLFLPIFLFSQGRNNLWLMGFTSWAGIPFGGTDINFINGSPDTLYHPRLMNFDATTASITDSLGNLLFYTNGVYIANRFDSLMMNGDNLNPSFYTTGQANDTDGLNLVQADIIIPKPESSSNYYLLHCTIDSFDVNFILYSRYLYFSEIDMTLDNGNGAVINKNVILLDDSINQGGISACKHGNGRDWWVICHQDLSNRFFKFLVTPDSIYGPFTQDIGSIREGYSPTHVFSIDGTKYTYYDANNDLDVFDFDRCTGTFSNWQHATINDGNFDGSVAFSPNGNLIYVTSVDKVFQYDLSNAILDSSQITVAVWDSTYDPIGPPFAALFRTIRLAPDNKIYISTGNGTRYLHVINYPDNVGLACDLQQHAVTLPTLNYNSIPYHPNYFLGPDMGSVCDSLGLGIGDNVYTSNFSLSVNPNPAQNSFYLNYQLPKGTNADLHIYNTLGDEVMRKKLYWYFGYLQIDASKLNNGVYFLRIQNAKGSASSKVVITK